MKKVYGYLGMLLVLTILISTTLVVAQTNFDVLREGFGGSVTGILDAIKINPASLSVLLFGVLIWMVLYSVVREVDLFKDIPFMSSGVAIILTILSFIYIPSDLFNVAGAQVGALGAVIITTIPIIIAFYFTTKVSKKQSVARIIWGAFGAYYAVILLYTWSTMPAGVGYLSLNPEVSESFKNSFYLIGFIISVLMIFFIPYVRKKAWHFDLEDKKEKIEKRTETLGAAMDAGDAVVEAVSGEE